MRLQLETEILRFGCGGLLELEDQIVAVALGDPGLADQHVALLLELDVGFAVLGVGNDGHGLPGGGNRFQRRVVERDRNGVVLLDEELGFGFCAFKEPSAFGTADAFLVCSIQCERGDANYDEGASEDS